MIRISPELRISKYFIALAIVAIAWVTWALVSMPREAPEWPSEIKGVSFSPLRSWHDPIKGRWPTHEEIRHDLELLEGKVRALRTYTVQGTLGDIPELAREYGFEVTLGAWITDDLERNEREIEGVIRIANENPNVTRVIVGNEALLRNDITVKDLIKYLRRVRRAVHVPVSTAEPWHVWLVKRELAAQVDFVAIQLLPWWEGVPLADAVEFVLARRKDVQSAFPRREIVISEVGWPSNGLTRVPSFRGSDGEAASVRASLSALGSLVEQDQWIRRYLNPAIPSASNQAVFLRTFLERAEQQNVDYYLMEAFDQPWKSKVEGGVGAYWGIYDVHRGAKFAMSGPIATIATWEVPALGCALLGIMLFGLFMVDSGRLRLTGYVFLAAVALVMAFSAMWLANHYAGLYFSLWSILVAAGLVVGLIGAAIVLMVEAHEMAEAAWLTTRRAESKFGTPMVTNWPKVSIHVPAYNEPPEMVINTLRTLSQLDYDNFEVLLIDNNTKDPEVWMPVKLECERLGNRFRFYHADTLGGFKAGALNFALRHTAGDAEIIAVIDSDYSVDSGWLRDLIPHFEEARVACVQAPQDYVPENADAFKSMCYAEYQGFFHLGMVTRNERNAIIQHGTMTMVRKGVLHEVGGWAEWCITEDAELGLRLLEHGYKAIYLNRSYGRGLLPDRFTDYKKQRFRWAYGAVQIMKRHAQELCSLRRTSLTWGQRYHFLAGWIPWLGDCANLVWVTVAILWSFAMVAAPLLFGPPPALFMLPMIGIFLFKAGKTFYLYIFKMRFSVLDTVGAIMAGTALSHTVAKAVASGLRTNNKPFFRTPKCENRPRMYKALAAALEETVIMVLLWIAAAVVALVHGIYFPAALVWSFLLLVLSTPYVSALVISIINTVRTMPRPAEDARFKPGSLQVLTRSQ